MATALHHLVQMSLALIRPTTLYAWKGPSLLIVNTRGDCADDESLAGYYFRETRFLRTLRLTINEEQSWLCEAASIDPASLAFYLCVSRSHPLRRWRKR